MYWVGTWVLWHTWGDQRKTFGCPLSLFIVQIPIIVLRYLGLETCKFVRPLWSLKARKQWYKVCNYRFLLEMINQLKTSSRCFVKGIASRILTLIYNQCFRVKPWKWRKLCKTLTFIIDFSLSSFCLIHSRQTCGKSWERPRKSWLLNQNRLTNIYVFWIFLLWTLMRVVD